MQVICDERGYVQSFAIIGNLVGGTELPEPAEMEQFLLRHFAYRMVDGKLEYDPQEYETHQAEEQKEDLRKRRETECFSVINRGQLWYEGVSLVQLLELRSWYKSWLNVTETMVVPDKPSWLT
ncbi:MAG: hypothetical protein J6Q53_03885 [Oscillospiraceae bacterium]|nr:hypothetical protein [Oscillospiraceae bacterium]